jgi:hypothetical protein
MEAIDQLHHAAALHPVPIEKEIVSTLEPVWAKWRKENFLPLSGTEAYPTSL